MNMLIAGVATACIKSGFCVGLVHEPALNTKEQWTEVVQSRNAEVRSSLHQSIRSSENGADRPFSESAKLLQKFAKNSQEYKVGQQISEELIFLSEEFYPEETPSWDEFIEWERVRVYKDNSIIDLQRSDYHLPMYRTVLFEGVEMVDANPDSAVIPTFGTSNDRMKSGLAPIGEDGQAIRLCRVVSHNTAPLYEMNAMKSADLLSMLESNMLHDEACLSEAGSSSYWLMRYRDFYDEYNAKK